MRRKGEGVKQKGRVACRGSGNFLRKSQNPPQRLRGCQPNSPPWPLFPLIGSERQQADGKATNPLRFAKMNTPRGHRGESPLALRMLQRLPMNLPNRGKVDCKPSRQTKRKPGLQWGPTPACFSFLRAVLFSWGSRVPKL